MSLSDKEIDQLRIVTASKPSSEIPEFLKDSHADDDFARQAMAVYRSNEILRLNGNLDNINAQKASVESALADLATWDVVEINKPTEEPQNEGI